MKKVLKNARVLVTARAYGILDSSLKTDLEAAVGEVIYAVNQPRYTPDELIGLVQGVDGWIASMDKIGRPVLQAAQSLIAISRFGVGVDHIDLDAAHELGIKVTNTPRVNANSVAEHTVGLILALVRKVVEGSTIVRSGAWRILPTPTLEGKTLGLMGFGQIGQAVAKRMTGFGMRILAYDPMGTQSTAQALGVEFVSQSDLITTADILCLHLPLTSQTHGMVDRSFLAAMKPGAFLINTARGDLVNEEALFDALNNSQLGGAALDVLSVEPALPGHPLLRFPNVIITPHMAGYGESAINAMGRNALENLLCVMRGEETPNLVV